MAARPRVASRPRPTHTRHPPRKRGIQYAAASRFNHCCLWNVIASEAKQSIVPHKERLDCFASLAMTAVIDAPSTATIADMISRSRDKNCPRFASCFALLEKRGRREDRVRAAPAVSCAIAHKERAHEHTGPAESIRPSLRNGFTAYFVISPVCEFL